MYFLGFLTLPTAYVTGNPVECVIHPELWNKTKIWDPLGVGQAEIFEDQYEEEYLGYPITSVSLKKPLELFSIDFNISLLFGYKN